MYRGIPFLYAGESLRQVVCCRTDLLERRLIALTFDDGSEQDCTSHILDAFSAHGGQATFFVLGSSIAGNEDLLKRAVAEGHELGNHLFSHESPIGRSDVFIWREIEQANRAIYEAGPSRARGTVRLGGSVCLD